MSSQGEDSYIAYLAPLLGSRVVAIEETDYTVLLFMSDGTVVEFQGEPDGGVSAELHLPRAKH